MAMDTRMDIAINMDSGAYTDGSLIMVVIEFLHHFRPYSSCQNYASACKSLTMANWHAAKYSH
jgi:hypothetical protein